MAHLVSVPELADARLDVFARLSEHQLRNALEIERGVFIAESHLVVETALDSGAEPLSFLVDERDLAASEALLARAGDEVPAYVLPHEQIARLVADYLQRIAPPVASWCSRTSSTWQTWARSSATRLRSGPMP